MENVEIRAVIKYLCKKGLSPKEIGEDFMDILWKESSSYSTVKMGCRIKEGQGEHWRK
jgi:hypothetical protein